MRYLLTNSISKLAILLVILTTALLSNHLFAAWSPAPPNPPSSNVDAPLHEGGDDQLKNAGLNLLLLIINGPTRLLNGPLYIQDGSEGTGKVLISDTSGQASWVATSTLGTAGGGAATLPTCPAGSYMVYTSGSWECMSSELQLPVTDVCASGEAIQSVNADGTVVCAPIPGPVSCQYKGVTYSYGQECKILESTVDTCRKYSTLFGWYEAVKHLTLRCTADGSWERRAECDTPPPLCGS